MKLSIKIIFILFVTNILLSCVMQKTAQQPTDLYRKWQLIEVRNADTKTATNYKSKKLFATFYKDGKMEFNLDVNSCSGQFKEGESQTLTFNATDFVCTQACCDTIRLNYHEVKKYEIAKKTLKLYSDKELFIFELAQ